MALRTENPELESEVMQAALDADLGSGKLQADYEHGQWWITDRDTGTQWSVVDAEGPGTHNGFDFEMVTPPDEE